MPAADVETPVVQLPRVFFATREDEYVGNLCKMRSEEAADRACTDDTDPHANFAWRYFRYGSGSMPDPVTRRSRSDGAYRPPWR